MMASITLLAMAFIVTSRISHAQTHLHSHPHVINLCPGTWIDQPHDDPREYHIHAATISHNAGDPEGSAAAFVKAACPAQVAIYSCYYANDDRARSERIHHMQFVPDPLATECHRFEPTAFLELIRNRRVFFHGDSILAQIWTSLVCTLHELEENYVYTSFWQNHDCSLRQCPVPSNYSNQFNPLFAHIASGYATFKAHNTSLILHVENHLDTIPHHVRDLELTGTDIVFVANGLHYNEVEKWTKDVEFLVEYLEEQLMKNAPANVPYFLVFHSSPQHFSTANGYWDVGRHYLYSRRQCAALPHYDEESPLLYELDWRNRVLETKLLASRVYLHPKLGVLPMSLGLNSRFDAHLPAGDCTHWCFPSGVFRFIHRQLISSLRKLALRPVPSTQSIFAPARLINWNAHPLLLENSVLRMNENIYFIVREGKLQRCHTWQACEALGYSIDRAKVVKDSDLGPLVLYEGVIQ